VLILDGDRARKGQPTPGQLKSNTSANHFVATCGMTPITKSRQPNEQWNMAIEAQLPVELEPP
jgi:hypothetical protein